MKELSKILFLICFTTLVTAQQYENQIGNFIGNFYDKSYFRDFEVLVESNDTDLFVFKCVVICRNKKYKYAGLQAGINCYCGDSYGKHGKAMNASIPCSGFSDEICGDINVNSVYRTNFIGCYGDHAGDRYMSHLAANDPKSMDVNKCIKMCRKVGYKYAGLQDGTKCFCGDNYGSYEKFTCDTGKVCSGSADQLCGDRDTNSVFDTNYLGCFFDYSYDRDLPYLAQISGGNIQSCIQACRDEGFKYAGLQNSFCYCGNSYGQYGKGICSSKCSSNQNDICGGPSMNSIYETNAFQNQDVPTTTLSDNLNADPKSCFKDYWGVKDLDGALTSLTSDNLIQECIKKCSFYFFSYSAVVNGSECWCGDTVSQLGREKNCNIKCIKNQEINCDSNWANSIYLNNITKAISITVCQDSFYNLVCPLKKKIDIKYAMYGRISKFKCSHSANNDYDEKCAETSNANMKETLRKVKLQCDSKKTCILRPNQNLFGNICQKITKYLEIKYACV